MEFDCKIGGVKYAGLELLDVQIGLPNVKTQQESVPGADGVIDLTDVLNGGPAYGNRTIKLRFGFDPYGSFDFYAFAGAVHGKRLKLELGNRSGYYIGRFTIGDIDKSKTTTMFDVEVDADPYRLEAEETSVTIPMLAASDNVMIGRSVTASGSSTSVDEYYDVVGDGASSVLRIKSVADTGGGVYGYARFRLPWPTAGSCLVSADVTDGWYTIVDVSGKPYGDGKSRWISSVPVGGLYMMLETINPGGCTASNIKLFHAQPGSLAGLCSDRLMYPVSDKGGVQIYRCDRTYAPATLGDRETSSPYLQIRKTTDYAYAIGGAAGELTLTGRRGWI